MKSIFVIFFTAISIFATTSLFGFNPQLYDLNRPIGSKLAVDINKIENTNYVENIINLLNKQITKHPQDIELYILRNSYVYILWDISPLQMKKSISKEGLRYAEETIKMFPNNPDGWIRKSIFLGTYAITVGVLNVLYLAKDIKNAALKAYQLNKRYYYAMPCQILGRIYFKLPPFPVSYGDPDKAAKYLYEAFKFAPNFAHIYMYLAELEASRGNIKLAEEFLDKIPQLHPKTWYELLIKKWTMRTLPKAKKYLREKWNKYEYDFLIDPARHPH